MARQTCPHCGWGMKTLCVTSMEVRELIQHMNRSEVAIEGFLLNILIDKLLMENKRKEAEAKGTDVHIANCLQNARTDLKTPSSSCTPSSLHHTKG